MFKKITFFILLISIAVTSFNCASTPKSTVIEDVNLNQLTQPAFVDDFAGKTVRFDATFMGTMDSMIHLPKKYQKNYVSIMVYGGGGQTGMPTYVLVKKEQSAQVYNFEMMQKLSIVAKTVKSKTTSGITGSNEDKLILVAEKITVIEDTE